MSTPTLSPAATSGGHVFLDGVWRDFVPETRLGALGSRITCAASSGTGRLLLRRVIWLSPRGAELPLKDAPGLFRGGTAGLGWYCPIGFVGAARERSSDGGNECAESLFRQDVTGLTALEERLHDSLRHGRLRQFHQLLAAACKALQEYLGRAAHDFIPGRSQQATDEPKPGIPLLSPAGLAVNDRGQPVLLDAGFVLDHHPGLADFAPPDFDRYFRHEKHVFGLRCAAGSFDSLQVLAMILYFREQLDFAQKATLSEPIRTILQETDQKIVELVKASRERKAAPSLGQLEKVFGLEQLEGVFTERGTAVRDDVPTVVAVPAPAPPPVPLPPPKAPLKVEVKPVPPPRPPEPKPVPAPPPPAGWPLSARVIAVLLGLACLGLLIAMLTFWYLGRPQAPQPGDPGSPYYYVIFPTPRVVPDQIIPQLQEAFPEAEVSKLHATAAQRQKLLLQHLQDDLKELKDSAPLTATLTQLAKNDVKFRGFDPADGEALRSVVEKGGGVFTYKAPAKEGSAGSDRTPSSLLLPGGPALALKMGGLPGDHDDSRHLDRLRQILLRYAAYEVLLNTVGDREAVIVKFRELPEGSLEPFRLTHRKLVNRPVAPLFSHRPNVAVYSAIDEQSERYEITGGNTLKVPVLCYWRLAGTNDRQGVNYERTSEKVKEQMRWRKVPAKETITWQQSGLRKGGQTMSVVSYDLAIPLTGGRNQVVIFRNQTLYSDANRNSVENQIRDYLTETLLLPADVARTMLDVNGQAGRFVGAISYSSLAPRLVEPGAPKVDDVEVVSQDEFDKLLRKEDNEVKVK